jgi:hypothetical protein
MDGAWLFAESRLYVDWLEERALSRQRLTTLNLGYTMTCKIERVLTPDGFVVLRVSGRIDGTYVATLRESMEKEKTTKSGLAIDLTQVTLVSQEAVEALAVAETNGIELRNCPAYVREWVSRAKESHD